MKMNRQRARELLLLLPKRKNQNQTEAPIGQKPVKSNDPTSYGICITDSCLSFFLSPWEKNTHTHICNEWPIERWDCSVRMRERERVNELLTLAHFLMMCHWWNFDVWWLCSHEQRGNTIGTQFMARNLYVSEFHAKNSIEPTICAI